MPYFDLVKRYGVSHTTIQNIFLTYLHAFHQIFFIGCIKNYHLWKKIVAVCQIRLEVYPTAESF